jgi:hypothetical protein
VFRYVSILHSSTAASRQHRLLQISFCHSEKNIPTLCCAHNKGSGINAHTQFVSARASC